MCLGSGDRLRIDFFNVPEYSGEYLVLPNGAVNLPQVGAVAVQGRTLKQASAAIAAKYEPYLTRPIVTIGLLAARPLDWRSRVRLTDRERTTCRLFQLMQIRECPA